LRVDGSKGTDRPAPNLRRKRQVATAPAAAPGLLPCGADVRSAAVSFGRRDPSRPGRAHLRDGDPSGSDSASAGRRRPTHAAPGVVAIRAATAREPSCDFWHRSRDGVRRPRASSSRRTRRRRVEARRTRIGPLRCARSGHPGKNPDPQDAVVVGGRRPCPGNGKRACLGGDCQGEPARMRGTLVTARES
jgi:hypothetical protein